MPRMEGTVESLTATKHLRRRRSVQDASAAAPAQRKRRKERLQRSRSTAVPAAEDNQLAQEQQHQEKLQANDALKQPAVQPMQRESTPLHLQLPSAPVLQPADAFDADPDAAAEASDTEDWEQQLREQFQAEQQALVEALQHERNAQRAAMQHELQLQRAALLNQLQLASQTIQQQPAQQHQQQFITSQHHIKQEQEPAGAPHWQQHLQDTPYNEQQHMLPNPALLQHNMAQQMAFLSHHAAVAPPNNLLQLSEALRQRNKELKRQVAEMEAQLLGKKPTDSLPGMMPDEFQNIHGDRLNRPPATPVTPPPPAAAAAESSHPPAALHDVSRMSRAVVNITHKYDSAVPSGVHVRLGQPCASGAMCAVHRGDLALSRDGAEMVLRPVAVKTFDAAALTVTSQISLQDVRNMAADAVYALRVLQGHPNVVRLLAAGQFEKTAIAGPDPAAAAAAPSSTVFCIVEELAECSVLDRMRTHGPMSEQEVQRHMRGLLGLLQHMHSGSIVVQPNQLGRRDDSSSAVAVTVVHRAVKPANLLLRNDGSIALADFVVCSIQERPTAAVVQGVRYYQQNYTSHAPGIGVAAAAAVAPPVGGLGCVGLMRSLVGTPDYMAPELAHAMLAFAAHKAAAAAAAHGDVANTPVVPKQPAPPAAAVPVANIEGFDATLDTYAAGVTVMEMLVGKLRYAQPCLSHENVQQQIEWLTAFADGDATALQCLLPQAAGIQVSRAAREFVGCCCGVGAARDAAAAAGQPKRLSAAQLLQLPWMQQVAGASL